MIEAPKPDDEAERLGALHALNILDTAPDAGFDELVELAALICDAPIALVSLVDDTRQWFKARRGTVVTELSRQSAFCAHAILGDEVMVIPDTAHDDRFDDNPLVVGEPHIRSYAGAPLRTSEGSALGTLCVIDRRPRLLRADQLSALGLLGRQAERLLMLHAAIAERASAESRLRASEERYRSTVDALDQGVITLDEHGAIVGCNPAASRILGRAPAQISGRTDIDPSWGVVTTDGRPVPPEQLPSQIALRTGQPVKATVVGVDMPDGSRSWLSLSATPLRRHADPSVIGTMSTFLDITATRSADRALRASEGRYRLLADNSTDLITYHGQDGTILYASPASASFGFAPGELIGRRASELAHADDVDALVRAGSVARSSTGRAVATFRVLGGDGVERWAETTMRRSVPEAEGQGQLVAVTRDVSERHQVEVDLRASLARERAAGERLVVLSSQKDALMLAVSHDLSAPLATVRMLAELLERPELGTGERHEISSRLLRAGRRAEGMVTDLLHAERFAHGGVPTLEQPVAIHELVERLVDELATPDHPICADVKPVLRLADRAQIERIVDNLLTNAVRHTPAGTQVWARLRARGEAVRLRVDDSGPGLPAEARCRVFEPYTRLGGSAVAGVGIGLSVVANFAATHGGRAWVEERPGGGCSFRVELRLRSPVRASRQTAAGGLGPSRR